MKKYIVKAACNTANIGAKVLASNSEGSLDRLAYIVNMYYSGNAVPGIQYPASGIHDLDVVYFQLEKGICCTFGDEDEKNILEYCGFPVEEEAPGYYTVYPE